MRKFLFLFCLTSFTSLSYGDNQTVEISPIASSDNLPFQIRLETADFSLPVGLQTYAYGFHKNKWLLISGRINGLHHFSNTNDNFPPNKQNTAVFVIDFDKKKVYSRSLLDKHSDLTQEEVDTLSVTAAEYVQSSSTLYLVGGYGVDTDTGNFSTKSTLTAIDIEGLIHWVCHPSKGETAKEHIRQTSHPILQVTGGALEQTNPHSPFLLIFGQNFSGFYLDSSNGTYTNQVRCFNLIDNGRDLFVIPGKQYPQDPNYRRRDLNVVPIIQKSGSSYEESFVALSGVFTLSTGIWTVPVLINPKGSSYMPNPAKASTFKQGMNVYNSAHLGLFSKKTNDMHTIILGGLGYIALEDGVFVEDSEIPFSNSLTDIRINSHGHFKQYLMENQYPVILSTSSNPGNPLLFGAGARFMPVDNLPLFPNGVFSLDDIKGDNVLLGYVVGGIQSTVPNTSLPTDSAASPYIFKVILERQ